MSWSLYPVDSGDWKGGINIGLLPLDFRLKTGKAANHHDCKWPLIFIACAIIAGFLLLSLLCHWFLSWFSFCILLRSSGESVFVDMLELAILQQQGQTLRHPNRATEAYPLSYSFLSPCPTLFSNLRASSKAVSPFCCASMSRIAWNRGRVTSIVDHNGVPRKKVMIVCPWFPFAYSSRSTASFSPLLQSCGRGILSSLRPASGPKFPQGKTDLSLRIVQCCMDNLRKSRRRLS